MFKYSDPLNRPLEHSLAEADSNLKWSRKIVRHGLTDQHLYCTNAASQAELFVQYGD